MIIIPQQFLLNQQVHLYKINKHMEITRPITKIRHIMTHLITHQIRIIRQKKFQFQSKTKLITVPKSQSQSE